MVRTSRPTLESGSEAAKFPLHYRPMSAEHPLWHCPVCRQSLQLEERTLRCADGHAFDRAKEGYFNLLLAHQKHSPEPGDSKAMVRNRREFLERDYYRPLAAQLAELCEAAYRERDHDAPFRLLDAGCGEGYYTGRVAEALAAGLRPGLHVGGTDIAKEAVRLAAKRHPGVHFAVAGSHALPVPDAALDLILCVFAPHYPEELARVLKPGGSFILVTPGPHHLYSLREQVYDAPKPHTPAPEAIEGMEHLERLELRFELTIDHPGDPGRLLAMTPYYWHASEEKQQHIAELERLATEAHFLIDLHLRP